MERKVVLLSILSSMVLSKQVGGRKRRRSEGDDVEDVGEVLRQVQKKLNESEEQHYFLLEKLGNSEERIMMLEEKEEERGEKKKKAKGYLPRDDEGAIFIAEFMREPVRKMVQRFPGTAGAGMGEDNPRKTQGTSQNP